MGFKEVSEWLIEINMYFGNTLLNLQFDWKVWLAIILNAELPLHINWWEKYISTSI